MNRSESRTEQQRRLFLAGRPSDFTVNALPVHVELCVDQDDRFGTLAPRTRDAVLIENIGKPDASSHDRCVGCVRQPD
jgi:hypothetical protein